MTTPLSALVDEQERLAGGARGLAALRLLLASLAIAVTLILKAASGGAETTSPVFGLHPVYPVAVAACAVEVIYLLLLRQARAAGRLVALITAGTVLDIVMTGVLVHLTGGYGSAFLPLLFVWVIAAGTVLSGRVALGAASLAVVCLSATLLVQHLSAPGRLWLAGAFHLAQSGALFIVAYLAGVLSRRLAAARLLADEVLAALDEGLLVIDRRGSVSYVNREAERLLGVPVRRGEPIDRALGDGRLAVLRELLAGSRERFGPARLELPAGARAGPGAAGEVVVSGAAVRDASGRFRGLIAVIADRSAERALEEAVRLAEQRRTVAELAMSIAHEIRNPLAAIRSAAQEVGREREISAAGRELAGVVIAESDRLDRIVTDFLTFARPRPPIFGPARLRQLADEALELAGRSAPPGKQVDFVNDVPRDLACRADADQVRQALLNLVLNGLAAIESAGCVRVRGRAIPSGEFFSGLRPERRARAGALREEGSAGRRPGVLIEVLDDGAGMGPEVMARAGEPFFTTRPEGTGLGLAIVERAAAAHGGAVSVDSVPGRGTVVGLWLSAGQEGSGNG